MNIIKFPWCQCGPFNISMEAEQQVQDLLFNLYADFYTFKSASCLPPCKTVEYKAFHKSYDAKSGRDILFFHGRVFLLDMFIEILKTRTSGASGALSLVPRYAR